MVGSIIRHSLSNLSWFLNTSGWNGIFQEIKQTVEDEDMEFSGVMKKQHVEFIGLN